MNNSARRRILAVTPGEPAGIGPEIALAVANRYRRARIVLVADRALLEQRAMTVPGLAATRFEMFAADSPAPDGAVEVLHVPGAKAGVPGELDVQTAQYVLHTLDVAVTACLHGDVDAMVTGPVHKGIINDAGIPFTGHTEYLARHASGTPVMMLAAPELRVALVTTHLPLAAVPEAISASRVEQVIRIVHADLRDRFAIAAPRIQVCGLNPHAGEGGHMGHEDDERIAPAIASARRSGITVDGPWPADTAFVPDRRERYDATIAMYHDQGLPVLKALGFGQAVNVTLGLNIIRTSVDHGTALDIAGQGTAESGSLEVAVDLARVMAEGMS